MLSYEEKTCYTQIDRILTEDGIHQTSTKT